MHYGKDASGSCDHTAVFPIQESIRDLLLSDSGAQTTVEIQIREDGTGGICLAGATERQVRAAWKDDERRRRMPPA